MKYKVLKPFFKLSESKNYSVGETIEMPKDDAQAMYLDGYLEEIKEVKDKTIKISDLPQQKLDKNVIIKLPNNNNND